MGPIIVAKATLELIPKTPIATAIASSKLLLAAVREIAVFIECGCLSFEAKK